MSRRSAAALGAIATALALWVVGERVVGVGWGRWLADALALAALLGATLLRLRGDPALSDAAPRARRLLVGSHAALWLAPALYALTDEGLRTTLGPDSPLASPELEAALGLAWPAALVATLSTLVFVEASASSLRTLDAAGTRRLGRALVSGLSLALSIVFVVSTDYAASASGRQWDLSYRKTTEPSEGTLRMAAAVTEDTRIVLFYPAVNPVLASLEPYFQRVAARSDKLRLEVVDHALAPALARRHHIRGNGYVAIIRGEGDGAQAESFEVGTELDAARSRLRTLDGRFQQSFSRLLHTRRELSFTAGHGEHTSAGQEGDDEGARVGLLDAALRRSNLSQRTLGMADGLAHEVPEDTPAVVVLGPRSPFLPAEADSLLRYARRGGRLLVLVDPDVDSGLAPLLQGLGLTLEPGVICSTSAHLARTHTDADRALVYTNDYSAHPTVTLANRHSRELASVFVGAGDLRRAEVVPAGVDVSFPMRMSQDLWLDRNGDYQEQEGEEVAEAHPMAAVTIQNPDGEEGRVVVIADGDFITDRVIQNPGNGGVLSDVFQWLLGEERVVTNTASEEDVPIEHTTGEDTLWFYATSFGLPLPILALGVFVAYRRRRHRPRRDARTEEGP